MRCEAARALQSTTASRFPPEMGKGGSDGRLAPTIANAPIRGLSATMAPSAEEAALRAFFASRRGTRTLIEHPPSADPGHTGTASRARAY